MISSGKARIDLDTKGIRKMIAEYFNLDPDTIHLTFAVHDEDIWLRIEYDLSNPDSETV